MGNPRIILLDIEIIPDLRKALKYWTKLSSFPGKTLRASVSSVCVIGWKVFGEDKIHSMCLWDYPEWNDNVNNDKPLLTAFAEIVSEADCIVTHNGKGFDWKHLQTRLILNNAEVMDDKINHVDTRQLSSRKFYFVDNKLQTLSEELFDDSKLDHEGWQLWIDVHDRKLSAMEKMAEYCRKDVELLEKVYRKLRPVAMQHFNHNLVNPYKERVCPRCGGSRLKSHGRRYTNTVTYRRYHCLDCSSWCHTNIKDELPR